MPSHLRTQIRSAVCTALTGLATTGSRVSAARMTPRRGSDLPCLLVETRSETIDGGPQSIAQHDLRLYVTGYAKANSALEGTLDQIAAEVETALSGAGTLSGLVPGGLYPVAVETDFDDSLDQPAGTIELEYRATYFARVGTPTATA